MKRLLGMERVQCLLPALLLFFSSSMPESQSTMPDFLDHCPSSCTCKWANGKREADCREAGFTAVPLHLHPAVQILRLDHNYVRKLSRNVFLEAGLINLQRIFINHCHLQEVDALSFASLTILVELDLSHNNVSRLSSATFADNERLQTLTLSHNRLRSLSAYQFPVLHHLRMIDVSHNQIASVDVTAFVGLGSSLEALALDHNLLRSLREELFTHLRALKSLQLHNNPWLCDCNLKHFRQWALQRSLYTYPTVCAAPERLTGRLWSDVGPEEFACKPEINVAQTLVFAQPGANVTLACLVAGSPRPDAKWVLKGRIVSNNSALESVQGHLMDENEDGGGQYVRIDEGEGEHRRWFNLTIFGVGEAAVADFTCVAVNAGGVMERNISLTFEEPETQFGLPEDASGAVSETSRDEFVLYLGVAGIALLLLFVLISVSSLLVVFTRRRPSVVVGTKAMSLSNSNESKSTTQTCFDDIDHHFDQPPSATTSSLQHDVPDVALVHHVHHPVEPRTPHVPHVGHVDHVDHVDHVGQGGVSGDKGQLDDQLLLNAEPVILSPPVAFVGDEVSPDLMSINAFVSPMADTPYDGVGLRTSATGAANTLMPPVRLKGILKTGAHSTATMPSNLSCPTPANVAAFHSMSGRRPRRHTPLQLHQAFRPDDVWQQQPSQPIDL